MFYAFDVLWMDGTDLRDRPLRERKRILFDSMIGSCAVYHSCTKPRGFQKFSTDSSGTRWYTWVFVCVTYTFHYHNPRRAASQLPVWHMPAQIDRSF